MDVVGWSEPRIRDPQVLIIGGGPHGLTVAAYLLRNNPRLQRSLYVVDRNDWGQRWEQQFAAHDIDILRSPVGHHPDPDPQALLAFAERTGRMGELRTEHQRPSTELFADFCRDLVADLGLSRNRLQLNVSQLVPEGSRVAVRLETGTLLRPKTVILADNASVPVVPDWAGRLPADRVRHSDQVDLRTREDLDGKSILVVGGGQTAGQLALGAAHRGATVTHLMRRPAQIQAFDVRPAFLDPEAIRGFLAEPDPEVRLDMVRGARQGGSMDLQLDHRLDTLQWEGQVRRVIDARPPEVVVRGEGSEQRFDVRFPQGDGAREGSFDEIWLGTGTECATDNQPLLASVQSAWPTPEVEGLPVLDPDCRWPGTNLLVVGGLAALSLGPTARNLSGARIAAGRAAAALTRGRQGTRQYPMTAQPPPRLAGLGRRATPADSFGLGD